MFDIEIEKNSKDISVLLDALNDHTSSLGVKQNMELYGFYNRDQDGKIIAGASVQFVYGAIYTDLLWVAEEYRGQGLGGALMDRIHQYGLEDKDCKMATLCTMSFESAVVFYQKIGYKIDFERKGYIDNSSVIYLSKQLV